MHLQLIGYECEGSTGCLWLESQQRSNAHWDVEEKLHVHGLMGDTGASSVDDGNQGPVQIVHILLRQEVATRASLVLNLQKHNQWITNASYVFNLHTTVS